MPLNLSRARRLLKGFDLAPLFIEEMGWDHCSATLDVLFDDRLVRLDAIAQKRGMVAFACQPLPDGTIPDHPARGKIERQVSKSFHEHLIVYVDGGHTEQVWQWVKRQVGRPVSRREHRFSPSQPGDSLIQKLQAIVFSLEEEESLTIVDVASRAAAAFDVERVTKRFYDFFKSEHDSFLKFVHGIPDEGMRRWYSSVMINRLMFIYFIQKKGFLDDDVDYLRNKLRQIQTRGKDHYYRDFLCPLFFEGFAKRERERSRGMNLLLGKVPYLGGGLFLRHQVEELYGTTIQVPDEAFERLLAFFDRYQWHLDERPLRADNEINPDVLGYIFEKYINQRQMGAYYTREDITEYIAKSTILPHLLQSVVEKCAVAFEGEHSAWRYLQDDPDRYISDVLKKGANISLPPEIAQGVTDRSKRTEWNKLAPAGFANPCETWRDVVNRRARYEELKRYLASGHVNSVEELVSLNIDIKQFVQDVIEGCEGPELLRAFWHALVGTEPNAKDKRQRALSILDPTCGSGAFLFAALNILEPVYEACVNRMQTFVDELDTVGRDETRAPHSADRLEDFRRVIEQINDRAQHPSPRYFILKSIMLNNLFGVDIMEEAVEICKLRLFLKLISQVDRVEDVEPLPDIDFNIRAGNTLVGFTDLGEVRDSLAQDKDLQGRLLFAAEAEALSRIEYSVSAADSAFWEYRAMQTRQGAGGVSLEEQKHALKLRLKELEAELNASLARSYGVQGKRQFDQWLETHQPFHWFVSFYGILNDGGFDVIIGNPPYVPYGEVKTIYSVRDYHTEDCNDLYALVMERSMRLLRSGGRLGMIVPVSSVSTDGFRSLRELMFSKFRGMWVSSFAERPAKLFEGVEKRLSIIIAHSAGDSGSRQACRLWVSKYHRWFAEERSTLFDSLSYVQMGDDLPRWAKENFSLPLPKIGSTTELSILRKLFSVRKTTQSFLVDRGKFQIYYTRKLRYFIQFFDFIPVILDERGKRLQPSELKELVLSKPEEGKMLLAALNSSLFFWFFVTFSDCRNVNKREILNFPIDVRNLTSRFAEPLGKLSSDLMEDFKKNSNLLQMHYKGRGTLEIQTFQPRESKPIIDEIDEVLAQYHGLTDEEVDFILNHDIKYRLGYEDSSPDDH